MFKVLVLNNKVYNFLVSFMLPILFFISCAEIESNESINRNLLFDENIICSSTDIKNIVQAENDSTGKEIIRKYIKIDTCACKLSSDTFLVSFKIKLNESFERLVEIKMIQEEIKNCVIKIIELESNEIKPYFTPDFVEIVLPKKLADMKNEFCGQLRITHEFNSNGITTREKINGKFHCNL